MYFYKGNVTYLLTKSVCQHQGQILIRNFFGDIWKMWVIHLFWVYHFILWKFSDTSFSFHFVSASAFNSPFLLWHQHDTSLQNLPFVWCPLTQVALVHSHLNCPLLVTENLVDSAPTTSFLKEMQYAIMLSLQRSEPTYPHDVCSCM